LGLATLKQGTARLCERIGLRQEPVAFFYSDVKPDGSCPGEGRHECVFALLHRVRRGETVYFDKDHFGCFGGGYYLGFCPASPTIAEFVSCGIPGELEGEHYKKSPDLVRAAQKACPVRPAPAPYAVFRPLSHLAEGEVPLVLSCFATPDELAGLVFLAGYARADDAIHVPFSSGCGSLVAWPLNESERPQPRATLGMFDPSARPFMPAGELSFSTPLALLEEMLGNAEESFLSTPTWAKLRRRITKAE